MFVHSSRIKKQIEHLKSKGIDDAPVYHLAEIDKTDVDNPEKLFSFEQYHAIFEYAIRNSGDEYYGLHMGREPHLAGTIGMMSASCKNLKEAFIQGCKFFHVQGNFADIEFIDDKNYPKIVYNLTNAWRLKYPDTARHEVDAMFSFLNTILDFNSKGTLKPYKILMRRSQPDDCSEYEKMFSIKPMFEQENDEIIFRQTDLLIPMKAFNPETFTVLKTYIESQLKRFKNEESISEKVRSVLLSAVQYQFPDIETVAARLNTSARTLQRKLSLEKTNFNNILLETKFDLAKEMIKQGVLTISEISYTLGYSDLGNFSRSFKKHTGMNPQKLKDAYNKKSTLC